MPADKRYAPDMSRRSYRCPECTSPNEFMVWVPDPLPNLGGGGDFPATWLVPPGSVVPEEPVTFLYRCLTCGYEARVPARLE
jgi:DNA-directed RNA polymerase subunit RPC12/RpoP